MFLGFELFQLPFNLPKSGLVFGSELLELLSQLLRRGRFGSDHDPVWDNENDQQREGDTPEEGCHGVP